MSQKMWAGRFDAPEDQLADDFNASIHIDRRMAAEDITGSMAHAAMLGAKGIIPEGAAAHIIDALEKILQEIQSGALEIDPESEDIHMFVEAELTRRIGDEGKMLHTARSRNDQVALDIRMYLRNRCEEIISLLQQLLSVILEQAKANVDTIMPGYTHLQRAQPVTFAHYMLAYGMMFCRDIDRVRDAAKRMNVCPLGSAALAGTTYPIDRAMTAKALGFDGYTLNSMDGVSDRDFCVELLSAFSLIMTHLSRMSEEIILWCSWEFGFVELSDGFTTGSSIMPQKKNADMAELVRGKSGRVYGDLMGMLTVLKGLPLAYNKDMQEDKEHIFDGVDTVVKCLEIFAPMLKTMKTKPEAMRAAAARGFINATDLADYLTKKGMPFRTAYKLVGRTVGACIKNGKTLEEMTLKEYQALSPLIEADVYEAIDLAHCVNARVSAGGTGQASLPEQMAFISGYLQ